MKVRITSALHSYTGRQSEVEAAGATLGQVVDDLERRFPGIRFRVVDEQDSIRRHIVFYVSGTKARDLDHPVQPDDEVMVVAALSGG